MLDDPRNSLPDIADKDNPMVWCERCRKEHRYWTFTRQDYDKMVTEMSKGLADAIDSRVEEALCLIR
jgi:hypothetical protein